MVGIEHPKESTETKTNQKSLISEFTKVTGEINITYKNQVYFYILAKNIWTVKFKI